MTLDERFFRYLEHFGPTVPVKELHARPHDPHLVGLRHDVDHDLDLALEVAYWEHEGNQRATFFLLHTAAYWHDERLLDKCLQLQDYGHEVGLHVNVLAEWWRGEARDPGRRLGEVLGTLREGGLDVTGVSAHGDRLCYEAGFSNYWVFADLRPSDPVTQESGRSAEGIHVDDPHYQLAYPPSHELEREDGQTLPLWQEPMSTHGLDYHAAHIPVHGYFTDSGGAWKRSPDPLDENLRRGRHQVLMHPVYYRAPTRSYFFLSTARAGSKWLTQVLDHGASVTARHEQTLNLRFRDDAFVEEKRTGDGFRALPHQPGQARRLLADARTWVDEHVVGDYAEANVYLVHILDHLARYFPDARLIHLHRHPYDVVRSLLERGWYETPEDDHHPALDVEGWDDFTQLEKACHYVRRVNERLLERGLPRMPLEEVTSDLESLRSRLRALGIATYPRLATSAWSQVVNAANTRTVPPVETWDRGAQRTLRRICGPTAARLGYRKGVGVREHARALIANRRAEARIRDSGAERQPDRRGLLAGVPTPNADVPVRVSGGSIETHVDDDLVVRRDGVRHTVLFIGGGNWERLGDDPGLPSQPGSYVVGDIDLEPDAPKGFQATIFALLFDEDGTLLSRRRVRNITDVDESAEFSFRPSPNCDRFVLALYVSLEVDSGWIRLRHMDVNLVAEKAGSR